MGDGGSAAPRQGGHGGGRGGQGSGGHNRGRGRGGGGGGGGKPAGQGGRNAQKQPNNSKPAQHDSRPKQQRDPNKPTREEQALVAKAKQTKVQGDALDKTGVSAALSRDIEFALYVSSASVSHLEEASGTRPPPLPASFYVDLLKLIDGDLKHLIKAPYRSFWSYVLHNASFASCIESYLQQAPRFYDAPAASDAGSEHAQLESAVRRSVLVVIARMSTLEESPSCYWTRPGYESAMRKTALFTVPNIIDMCAVYFKVAKHILPKLLEKLFSNLTYLRAEATREARKVIDSLTELEPSVQQAAAGGEAAFPSLLDRHHYVHDAIESLRAFYAMSPADITHAAVDAGLLPVLVNCYQRTLPLFVARNLDSLWSERGRERHRRLQRTAIRLISDLVQVAVLDRLYDAQNDIVASAFDNLIRFMDLTAAFEHSDADTIPSQPLLLAVNKRLDLLRILHRLRNATLHSEAFDADAMLRFHLVSLDALVNPVSSASKPASSYDGLAAASDPLPAPAASSAAIVDPMRMSLVSAVKDILPDLGDAFVDACLKHYGDNVESVINALLEDNLPPRLASLDRATGRVPLPAVYQGKGKQPAAASPAPAPAPTPAAAPDGLPTMATVVQVTKRAKGRQPQVHVDLGIDESERRALQKFMRGRTFDLDDDEYDDSFDEVDVVPLERDGAVFQARN